MTEIHGLAELIADLTVAGTTVKERATDEVQRIAQDVVETARRTVPVITGTLRDSIEVSRADGAAAEVGPTAPYGAFVEFGTSTMGPQPYMGPAADEHEADLAAAIAEVGGDI